jgi:hypothetical protein
MQKTDEKQFEAKNAIGNFEKIYDVIQLDNNT